MDETSFITCKAETQNDVIRFYDDYAASWDKRFGELPSTEYFLNRRWQSFEYLLGNDTHSSVALELGVGTGVYIERASRRFKHIIAADGSAQMLRQLENKLQQHRITNVKTLLTDAVDLAEVPNESVDIVYFFGLVEHIIEVDRFFHTLYRVLRPKGAIIGVTPNGKSPWYAVRRLIRHTDKHCTSDHYYRLSDVQSWCSKYGFKTLEHYYWGFVPAGINGLAFTGLKLMEKPLELSPLRSYGGGLSFKLVK